MTDQNKKISEIYRKLTQIELDTLTFHNRILIQDMSNLLDGMVSFKNEKLSSDTSEAKFKVLDNPFHEFKLMVIDDDEDTLRLIRYALKNENISLHTFVNPEEALEQITKINPSLIILDFMMPEMTALEVLLQMKERDILKDYTVIIGSAKNNSEDKANALKLGANDYIVKPYDLTELKLKINKYKEKDVA